jgi:hypothetical protein
MEILLQITKAGHIHNSYMITDESSLVMAR